MFGYISPLQGELKLNELAVYRAYYCGVCKEISRKLGQAARFTLSYDCTFIAILLESICLNENNTKMERCPRHPIKKRPVAQSSENLSFVANLNLLLAWYKMKDDWNDEKNLLCLSASGLLKGAADKANHESAALGQSILNGINELSKLEKSNCMDLDAPADAFARMMLQALKTAPYKSANDKIVVPRLAYHIGRWLYIIDAWDDREKDMKNGSYNVLSACNAGKDRAEFLLNCSMNEAIDAYGLLDIKCNEGLLNNIIYDGCRKKAEDILGAKV